MERKEKFGQFIYKIVLILIKFKRTIKVMQFYTVPKVMLRDGIYLHWKSVIFPDSISQLWIMLGSLDSVKIVHLTFINKLL